MHCSQHGRSRQNDESNYRGREDRVMPHMVICRHTTSPLMVTL
ncbi:hypothetical protein MANES_06G168250v8 [Manihot esculenta]|uniref:Uncharacterized protein n=1 Tax=Manihot esculenta TaxID=3983 RepID=A0ACB7HKP9_MANES|nr:hypothetical protein MANES_06G168250v8 [Manihot esculenta]